jgi:tetratricopeptide (TPR) repeat protein
VGLNIATMDEFMPGDDVRALEIAVERGDVPRMVELSGRLLERFPDQPSMVRLRVGVLALSERWDEAVVAMEDVEPRDDPGTLDYLAGILVTGRRYEDALVKMERLEEVDPSVLDRRYWNNNFAWSVFMARGSDPDAVKDGLRRVHRELKKDPDDRVVRNTLALGLYLSGRYVQAEKTVAELMVGRSIEDRSDDVFLHILTLLALGRDEAALAEYEEFVAVVPEGGELKERALRGLAERGLLPAAEQPLDVLPE